MGYIDRAPIKPSAKPTVKDGANFRAVHTTVHPVRNPFVSIGVHSWFKKLGTDNRG